MKDKIFCPSCGHIYDASEFITVYGNETKYICGTCHSNIKIEICDIRYTYYDILLKCSDDDFTVKTFNKKDSVQLLVAFNEFPKCGLEMDRDLNGARNIFLKNISLALAASPFLSESLNCISKQLVKSC